MAAEAQPVESWKRSLDALRAALTEEPRQEGSGGLEAELRERSRSAAGSAVENEQIGERVRAAECRGGSRAYEKAADLAAAVPEPQQEGGVGEAWPESVEIHRTLSGAFVLPQDRRVAEPPNTRRYCEPVKSRRARQLIEGVRTNLLTLQAEGRLGEVPERDLREILDGQVGPAIQALSEPDQPTTPLPVPLEQQASGPSIPFTDQQWEELERAKADGEPYQGFVWSDGKWVKVDA